MHLGAHTYRNPINYQRAHQIGRDWSDHVCVPSASCRLRFDFAPNSDATVFKGAFIRVSRVCSAFKHDSHSFPCTTQIVRILAAPHLRTCLARIHHILFWPLIRIERQTNFIFRVNHAHIVVRPLILRSSQYFGSLIFMNSGRNKKK